MASYSYTSYTCGECNKRYALDDPAFVYWRVNAAGENLDGRGGRARSSFGWFARCRDREACRARRENVHAGVNPEQLGLVYVRRAV